MILFLTIMLGCLYLMISTAVQHIRSAKRIRAIRVITFNKGIHYASH